MTIEGGLPPPTPRQASLDQQTDWLRDEMNEHLIVGKSFTCQAYYYVIHFS